MKKEHILRIPKHPLLFWWYIAKKHKGWMVSATSFVVLAQTADSLWPYLMKQITDSVTIGNDVEKAVMWIMSFGLVIFIGRLMWRGSGFTGMQWVTRSRAVVGNELMEYLTGHSEAYFRNKFSGSLVNKIKNVTQGIASLIETYLWSIIELIILFPVSVFLAFQAHWIVGWCIVGWILFMIPINTFFIRRKRRYSIAHAQSGSELSGQAVDVVTNMSSVRQYVSRMRELLHIGTYIEKNRLANLKNWRASEWMLVTNDVVQSLILIGLLAFSAHLWKVGMFTGGDVILVLNIGIMISHRLTWVGNSINTIMDSYGEIHEGLDQIITDYNLLDDSDAKPFQYHGGEIRFDKVDFAYEKSSVFSDLSFTIKPGQKVGLVGESGAGKSTLVQLLLRQYDINDGKILFDDQNIAHVTQDSLRGHIAFVPQDPVLFHRTLAENIGYGRKDATQDEIEQAAELAQAHEFITELPEGYKTLVGERGVKLSGGQRQRIIIARAILKNAPILVLDEATSALDSESEEKIQLALSELMKGKTVIAIAHRLSTIKHLDRILVFDQGKIVEDGSHADLSSSSGVYGKLWTKQVGGFIGE